MPAKKPPRKPVKKSARKSVGPSFGSLEALERVTRAVPAKKAARRVKPQEWRLVGGKRLPAPTSAEAIAERQRVLLEIQKKLLAQPSVHLSDMQRLDLRKWCVEQAVKWPVFPLYPSRGEPGRLELRSPAVTAWAQQIYDWVTK